MKERSFWMVWFRHNREPRCESIISLRKQPTFPDASTGFPGKWRGETSGGITKCRLFSQAKVSSDRKLLLCDRCCLPLV